MQASALRLLCGALLLLAGCVGRIGEVGSSDVADASASGTADAGARADSPISGARRPDSGRPPYPTQCDPQPLARGMRLKELAMYQTVKVSLFEEGGWHHATNRTAPIVQGKETMARAFVDLDPDYEPHTVRGVLRLREGDRVQEFVDTRKIEARSKDDDLATTFSFKLKSTDIGENTEVSIALEEPTCQAESGLASDTRYPSDGAFEPLEATFIDRLHVRLVPFTSNGRTPTIDPVEREKMRRTLLAYYPVPEVVVDVREAVQTETVIDNVADQPWHDMLQELIKLRADDHVESDIYYVALVQPDDSMRTFCQSGCYLGIAPTTMKREARQQVALVAIFPDSPTYESVVHELGHAHGREHAPCANGSSVTVGVDKLYPLSTGATETWGWDFRTRELMAPNVHMDIMGYCEPNWISTYNYSALADRSSEVNGDALYKGPPGVFWKHVILYANGEARWGKLDDTTRPPGNLEDAEVLDAAGKVLTTVKITRIPLSHISDQWAYLPRTQPGWAAIKLRDRLIPLDTIQPAK